MKPTSPLPETDGVNNEQYSPSKKLGFSRELGEPTQYLRYPHTDNQCPRIPLRSGKFNEEEVVRLMLQQLQDMGYTDALATLQNESGYQLEQSHISAFRRNVLNGQWSDAEKYIIDAISDYEKQLSAKLIIRQQHFLELLERKKIKKALAVLQKDLVQICENPSQLHYLSGLLMCSTPNELRSIANWKGVNGGSRMLVLESLQKFISPNKMVPPHRLESLLQQAVQHQTDNCKYHISCGTPHLYMDHECKPSTFPRQAAHILRGHTNEVWFVGFSNNGEYLASASKDKTCIIWNTKTGQSVVKINKFLEPPTSCKWFPDGRHFITGSLDWRLTMWDLEGTLIKEWKKYRVHDIVLSQNGKTLVVADNENSIHIYDLERDIEVAGIPLASSIMSVFLSQDGKFCLVSTEDNKMTLIDMNAKSVCREIVGDLQNGFRINPTDGQDMCVIRSCFGGPNDSFIISGSQDGSICIWSRHTGLSIAVLKHHTKPVGSCSWNYKSPEPMFASCSDDTTVIVWMDESHVQRNGGAEAAICHILMRRVWQRVCVPPSPIIPYKRLVNALKFFEEYPLLVPESMEEPCVWRLLRGFIKVRGVMIPLTLKFDEGWEFSKTMVESTNPDVARILASEHNAIEKRAFGCMDQLGFLEIVKDVIDLHFDKVAAQARIEPEYYEAIVSEFDIIGWECVRSFCETTGTVCFTIRDLDEREWKAEIVYSEGGRLVCRCEVEHVRQLQMRIGQGADPGWLKAYIKDAESCLNKLRIIHGLLEDLDATTCVVHPEKPTLLDWHRRIALGSLLTLTLRVPRSYPAQPPELIPHGPPASTAPLITRIGQHRSNWKSHRSARDNIHNILGMHVPSHKSGHEDSFISDSQDSFSMSSQKNNQQAQTKLECGICYSYRIAEDEEPGQLCPNDRCAQPFHTTCLTKEVQSPYRQQTQQQLNGKTKDSNSSVTHTPLPVSEKQLQTYEESLGGDLKSQLASLTISGDSYNRSLENKAVLNANPPVFSHTTEIKVNITDQKSSGRCWIFAGLNMLRQAVMKENNLDDFQFSQSYLFFFDKIEKSNWFLENIIDTLDEPLDSRVVQYLLSDPIGDGGQWDMFVSLVQKYGVVPQYAFPESHHSSNSSEMDWLITVKLREFASQLRKQHSNGVSVDSLQKAKGDMLRVIYRILAISLGEPPKSFDWTFEDKDAKYKEYLNLTPHSFFKDLVKFDIGGTISLINDPRNDYYKLYTVKYLGNVVGGVPIHYINLPVDKIKEFSSKVIIDKRPVWFGCDVGKFLTRQKGTLDPNSIDYDKGFDIKFGLSKSERLQYGESLMTHAMVLTGVHYKGDERLRWRVENSWGPNYGASGYLVMTENWFDEYVYQVVLEKKDLPDNILSILEQKPVVLPPWDPMGSLA
ncbi:bleomycin hydrolase [Mycoemilia scoparia]|uniref:Cysteine proteinase 1, mitochondrial n=1 Tax=Mycoemilia scoparia TaxID=417184 RepID=A0A9W8DUD0_9FUNG|nr:bleomycin hydrolase [Mycoemilia scoparia]